MNSFERSALTGLIVVWISGIAVGDGNLLEDPGFERFHFDESAKCYRPDDDAAWHVVGDGGVSIRFDASDWSAPKAMKAERKPGFTPGAHGFDGHGTGVNSGVLCFEQNIVAPAEFTKAEEYQAWVWLGGAGHDDDHGKDLKDERGGWEIRFFASDEPSQWTDQNMIERHHSEFNYWGKPESFVCVSGHGRVPKKARGARMTVHAMTWSTAKGADYDTKVALDNAHFSFLKPNMLVNGNFEQDETATQFKGWTRPAEYDFQTADLEPRDINNAWNPMPDWDHNFDHGLLLPFHGGKWAYGYNTYLCGWKKGAFTFSQDVKYRSALGPLTLMCHWIQNTKNMKHATQFRDGAGTSLEFALQYHNGPKLINTETFDAEWPIAANPENQCADDQNPWRAYHPMFRIEPPRGTDRITVNVCFKVDLAWQETLDLIAAAVDHFYLGPVVAGN